MQLRFIVISHPSWPQITAGVRPDCIQSAHYNAVELPHNVRDVHNGTLTSSSACLICIALFALCISFILLFNSHVRPHTVKLFCSSSICTALLFLLSVQSKRVREWEFIYIAQRPTGPVQLEAENALLIFIGANSSIGNCKHCLTIFFQPIAALLRAFNRWMPVARFQCLLLLPIAAPSFDANVASLSNVLACKSTGSPL